MGLDKNDDQWYKLLRPMKWWKKNYNIKAAGFWVLYIEDAAGYRLAFTVVADHDKGDASQKVNKFILYKDLEDFYLRRF